MTDVRTSDPSSPRAPASTADRADRLRALGVVLKGKTLEQLISGDSTEWRAKSMTSAAAREAAEDIAQSSTRRKDTSVRKSFVRTETADAPALAQLFTVGGRGGTVAIKLYLALLWRCSSEPYVTDKPARAWASLLDLPDPETRGARRVQDAMKTLAELELITITAQAGAPNLIELLDESGNGRPYTLPSSSYGKAKAQGLAQSRIDRHRYFKLATTLWTEGWIQQMSGPALVMLLILLAEQAGQGKELWVSPSAFAQRYQVSHNTRTKGVNELKTLQLLTVTRQGLPNSPTGSVFDRRRTRSVYRLDDRAITDPPT